MTHLKTDNDQQYSLIKILTIWGAVSIPMPLMAFWIAPTIAADSNVNPLVLIWLFLIAGMIWQFILSVGLLYNELDKFTWPKICERIWLKKPVNPNTGMASYQYFWWVIPAFGFWILHNHRAHPCGGYYWAAHTFSVSMISCAA